jgi:hypothetical protein
MLVVMFCWLGLIYGLNPQVPTAKNGRKVILFEAY